MCAVKLTSLGKCSKGPSTRGERYLRATELPQRHMERGKQPGVCLFSGYVTLVESKNKKKECSDFSIID